VNVATPAKLGQVLACVTLGVLFAQQARRCWLERREWWGRAIFPMCRSLSDVPVSVLFWFAFVANALLLTLSRFKWPFARSPRSGERLAWYDRSWTVVAWASLPWIAAAASPVSLRQQLHMSVLNAAGVSVTLLIVGGIAAAIVRVAHRTLVAGAARYRFRGPPGSVLLQTVKWLCSPRTVDRIYAPLIADMQHEYREALWEGRYWKARWIVARGYWGFMKTLSIARIVSLARSVFEIWRAGR
jgi:hypothetical protein